ncbi:MAG: peroxiredoxin-like family protein [Pseudomonadota bacterium]
MSDLTPLLPRQAVPSLTAPLVGGGEWSLAQSGGDPFTMIVFYRGLHCPICKTYLGSLEKLLDKFSEKGIEVIALSTDGEDRAQQAKTDWALPNLKVGHSVSLSKAREWGLYVSSGIGKTSIGIEEPAQFAEPAIYFVRPDGTLYFGSSQTMPFARPRFEDILPALDFVIARNYPARGEVDTLAAAAAA